MKLYYNNPVQVRFADPGEVFDDGIPLDDATVLGGIAFHECVICGCCGVTWDLDEFTEEEWNELGFEELNWVNINEEIRGGI